MASQPTPQPSSGHELWNRLVLPEKTKQFFRRLIAALRDPSTPEHRAFLSLHDTILLSGPPGTGKTLVERAIVEESGVFCVAATRSDFVPGYIGQGGNAVRELFKRVPEHTPSLLVIDEVEQVFPSRQYHQDQFAAEIIPEVLMELDSGKDKGTLVILADTNRPELIDEAVLARFRTRIELGYPNLEGRRAILRDALALHSVDFDLDQVSLELAETTGQLSGRDLHSVVYSAAQAALERAFKAGAPDTVKLTRQDLLNELLDVQRSSIAFAATKTRPSPAAAETQPPSGGAAAAPKDIPPDEGLAPLNLPAPLQKKFAVLCKALHNFETIGRQGIALPKGALLYGASAADKAELARQIARLCDFHFLSVGPVDFQASMIGQSARMVHEIFERARNLSPCILFVGEADAITPERLSPKSNSFTIDTLNQWLIEQDGLRKAVRPFVFIVAATDHLDDVATPVQARLDRIDMAAPPANG